MFITKIATNMKKILLFTTVITTTASAYSQDFRLEYIPSVAIPVTVDKMTNLVFPEAIQPAVKVSTEIAAQLVHGVLNVIEIKALRRHFTTTNLTAYGKDGRLYSFTLHYVDDTSILNFRILPASPAIIQLQDLPITVPALRDDAHQLEVIPSRLHARVSTDHLTLRLTGAWSKDNLEWLTFSISNRSALDFLPETIRFYLQDRKEVRRRAIQELDLQPVYQDCPLAVDRQTPTALAMAFTPFHIAKGKRLVCECRGKDDRLLQLKVSRRKLRISK